MKCLQASAIGVPDPKYLMIKINSISELLRCKIVRRREKFMALTSDCHCLSVVGRAGFRGHVAAAVSGTGRSTLRGSGNVRGHRRGASADASAVTIVPLTIAAQQSRSVDPCPLVVVLPPIAMSVDVKGTSQDQIWLTNKYSTGSQEYHIRTTWNCTNQYRLK
jgi:hypothetical protein